MARFPRKLKAKDARVPQIYAGHERPQLNPVYQRLRDSVHSEDRKSQGLALNALMPAPSPMGCHGLLQASRVDTLNLAKTLRVQTFPGLFRSSARCSHEGPPRGPVPWPATELIRSRCTSPYVPKHAFGPHAGRPDLTFCLLLHKSRHKYSTNKSTGSLGVHLSGRLPHTFRSLQRVSQGSLEAQASTRATFGEVSFKVNLGKPQDSRDVRNTGRAYCTSSTQRYLRQRGNQTDRWRRNAKDEDSKASKCLRCCTLTIVPERCIVSAALLRIGQDLAGF